MAFYADSAIQVHVPRIRYREDLVAFTHVEAGARLTSSETDRLIGAAIEVDLLAGTREEGKQYQVFLLSAADDPDTVLIAHPIQNDTVAEPGRGWAWTMGQRYISLAALMRPGVSVTSALDAP